MMTVRQYEDRVSGLLIDLLEMLPEEKHDHLEQLAYAIDAFATAFGAASQTPAR